MYDCLVTQHRHLNHEQFTLAAVDDVIARGRREDWEALRRALLENIQRVRAPHRDDSRAQRRQFWMHHVERRPA